MKKATLTLAVALFLITSARAERYEFWEYPNIPIPGDDSDGVWDSLYIDQDILIEDLNVYIGINTGSWADLLAIPVFSPWADTVYLINRNPSRRLLNIWFDTESEEDGPGELEDFVGFNARGLWTINPTQVAGHYPFIFSSWAIEIYGEPLTGIDHGPELPLEFGVISTYPNPFNNRIRIEYGITDPGRVVFEIYNVLGQRVAMPVNGELQPGVYDFVWDASNASTGIYFYVLRSGDRTDRGRMTLLK